MNRTRLIRSGALSLVIASAVAGAALAADWPQWRGPDRTGISKETGLLPEWPAEGPKLLWSIKDAGSGYGTPAIAGGKLFLISNQGETESLFARDAASGKVLWTVGLGKVGNPDQQPSYPGSRSTPTVDGALLYALGSDGDLKCVETASGKVRWSKSLRADFGGQPGVWAYSESPLVDGDAVVVTPGGPQATLVALNKRTGDVIWKSAVPGGDQAAYASVIIVNEGGVKQYVQFLQKGLVGVDAKTGKFLWRYDRTAMNSPANIPTPVAGDGYVYSASGRGGGALVRLKNENGVVTPEQVYYSNRLPTAIGGAVRIGDYLYGTATAGLLCVHWTTGEVKWQERGIGAASLAYADGRLYLHGENGQVALVEPTPEGYREKGKFTPPELPERPRGAMAWAYPVIANGKLYIRDQGSLWCFDVKK